LNTLRSTLVSIFKGTTMSRMQLNITGFVPYEPEESYFPGATQSSPPTVARALNVYKDELLRPIAFDLGTKGDSRSALRELCQKAVLEINPVPESALLQSTISERSGGGTTSAVGGTSGGPSLAQMAEGSTGTADRYSSKAKAPRAPRAHSSKCRLLRVCGETKAWASCSLILSSHPITLLLSSPKRQPR
jgi:hypothetical protein